MAAGAGEEAAMGTNHQRKQNLGLIHGKQEKHNGNKQQTPQTNSLLREGSQG